jgi:hypothetical protein
MRTHTAHSKALKAAHAAEIAFLEAQRKLQIAQAAERAAADGLESAREHAELTTSRVQQKNREVEMLRAQKVRARSRTVVLDAHYRWYRQRTFESARTRSRSSPAKAQ